MRVRKALSILLVSLALMGQRGQTGQADWTPAPANSTFVKAASAPGQWVQSTGPSGGLILTLLANGTDIYAGTEGGGVFRSTDQGASWTPVNAGLSIFDVPALGASGPHLLAGTLDGIFLSANQGQSWTRVATRRFMTSFITVGTKILAGSMDDRGVLISTDQGRSWTESGAGLPSPHSFAVSGTNLFAATYLYNGGPVYRSTDQGATWRPAATGLPDRNAFSLAASGSSVFVGTDAGVFVTTDQGEHWTPVNEGLADKSLNVRSLVVSGTKLFAATEGGIFSLSNQEKRWIATGTGIPLSSFFVFFPLAVSGGNLFAGTIEGVFRSTDQGRTWRAVNKGLCGSFVERVVVSGANLFAATVHHGIFRSTDQGRSWTAINAGLPYTRWVTSEREERIHRTRSWTAINAGLPYIVGESRIHALVVSGTTLFAGTDDGVYRSSDQGQHWLATSAGIPPGIYVKALAVSGTSLFAGTREGVFISTNNGRSWTAANAGVTLRIVTELAGSNAGLVAGGEGGIFVSTNNGQNWTASGNGLPEFPSITALFASETTLWASIFGLGIYRSTDQGRSWTEANAGLPGLTISLDTGPLIVYSFAASGKDLYAGTIYGVYRSTDQGQSWTAINAGLPPYTKVFSLAVRGANLFAGTDGKGVFVGTGFVRAD